MKRILAFVAVVTLGGCDDPYKDMRAAEAIGLRDVKPTGFKWFACSKDDMFHAGFEAIDQRGQKVTGTICSGFLKGHTVRLD